MSIIPKELQKLAISTAPKPRESIDHQSSNIPNIVRLMIVDSRELSRRWKCQLLKFFGYNVPSDLLAIQRWFAEVITRPIDQSSRMTSLLDDEEVSQYIAPSPTLSSVKRIQIYHQQYWWRLFTTLQHHFPTLTRLFGYTDFNLSIALPFLTQYPSRHWSLSKLGELLTVWLKENYEGEDKELILAAAEVDWAYQSLFVASPITYLEPSPALISKRLYLQPHVQLFRFSFNLFSWRETLLEKPVEFWVEAADFPSLQRDKEYFYLLYRTAHHYLVYREIEEGEWTLLNAIDQGLTIEEACAVLESRRERAYQEATASLDVWVRRWMRQGILGSSEP